MVIHCRVHSLQNTPIMEKNTGSKNEQSSAAVFEQLEVFVTAETNAPVFIKAGRYIHVSQFQAVSVRDVKKCSYC